MDNQNTQVVSSFEVGESSVPFRSAFFPESSDDQFELQKQFILLELQRLIESYNEVSSQLHHTICYIDTLKKENLLLESEKLKLLSADCDQDGSSPSSSTIIPNLELQTSKEAITEQNIPNPLPSNLPKSISIRSAGFLASRNHPIPLNLPAASPLQNDGVVKVDAYSQGMTKTELCNKWGEMGACPYAEHCRFAHGLEELRPVIRHPRYKTQLCRMLANDGGCPYGHRCHFRHAAISTTFND